MVKALNRFKTSKAIFCKNNWLHVDDKSSSSSSQEWFTVYEHNRRPSCTVSDLIMGNEYTFRVLSENICGMSDDAAMSKNTAVISKTGTGYWKLQKLDSTLKSLSGLWLWTNTNPSNHLHEWISDAFVTQILYGFLSLSFWMHIQYHLLTGWPFCIETI